MQITINKQLLIQVLIYIRYYLERSITIDLKFHVAQKKYPTQKKYPALDIFFVELVY